MREHVTFHLTPREVWERQASSETYTPEAYETDGFIHCTDGEENMLRVANLFYRLDPRGFVLLSVDVDRLSAEVKYEDAERIFPHVYGPMNVDAIVGVRNVLRDQDGTFVGFSE